MNAHLNHVIMEELVQIYHKAIVVNARKDILEKIVKKNKAIATMIHAQLVQCAKMNQAMEISHVYAEMDTPEMIAMQQSIHAQLAAIHARMALHVWLCNKADSNVIACLAGLVNLVTLILTIVLKIHVYLEQIVPI